MVREPLLGNSEANEMSSRGVHGANKKVKRCYINKLPVEILADIFVTAMDLAFISLPGESTPGVICRVCSLWNAIATSCPALWSTYYPEARHLPHTRAILSRSENHPLTLKMYTRALKDCSGLKEAYAFFIEQGHRWRSLDIYMYDWMVLDFITALSRTGRDFVTLKIDVDGCVERHIIEITQAILEHCPHLRHLEYRCSGVFYNAFVGLPWERLSSLKLVTLITIEQARQIMSSCVAATHIELSSVKADESLSMDNWDPSFAHVLPCLQHLRLDTSRVDPAEILVLFRTPRLHQLELHSSRSTLSNLATFNMFLVNSECRLESLMLYDNGFMKDPSTIANILLLEPLQQTNILDIRVRIPHRHISTAVNILSGGKSTSLRLRPLGPGLGGVYMNRSKLADIHKMYY